MRRIGTKRIYLVGFFILGLALVFQGCSTSASQLRRGQALAMDRRYIEAAFNFVRALEGGLQEANVSEAQTGLTGLVPSMLDETRAILTSAERTADFERAVLAVEGLLVLDGRAQSLGLRLFEGNTQEYAEIKRDASRLAFLHAQDLESKERWSEAVAAYQSALGRLEPDSSMAAEIKLGETRALLRLGEQQLFQGDYIGAYRSAMQALNTSSNPILSEQATRLLGESEAVRLAQEVFIPTYYFAALPFYLPDSVRTTFPEDVFQAFNDTLRYAFWSERPQLMFEGGRPSSYLGGGAAVSIWAEDPTKIFRLLIDREHDTGITSDAQARNLGSTLDVDIALWGTLGDYRIETLPGSAENTSVTRVSCSVSYRLVDVYGSGLIGSGNFRIGAAVENRDMDKPPVDLDAGEIIPIAQELDRMQMSELRRLHVRRLITGLKQKVSEDLLSFADTFGP